MSPVGVTPVAVVAHLMLDSVAWVDGVDTKPCSCVHPGDLDEPGWRCYQERWSLQGRIGDGLHGKG